MITKNVLLIFNKTIMYKPIIYRLARDFDATFNVLEAKILPKLEGRIILELRGNSEESIAACLEYLAREGVTIEPIVDRISRDEERCIHCGACTSVCRVDALTIDRVTMKVLFNQEKCVACGMCKAACPVKAMSGTSIDLD